MLIIIKALDAWLFPMGLIMFMFYPTYLLITGKFLKEIDTFGLKLTVAFLFCIICWYVIRQFGWVYPGVSLPYHMW